MLSAQQLAAREGKLTASAVGTLVSGNNIKITNLWRSLVGDPTYQPDDLSGVWPVALGNVTEELNLDWYARKSGFAVTRRGEVVVCREYEWAAATIDGWVEDGLGYPVECKHVGGREQYIVIRERYLPQMQWQMLCTERDCCAFSVIEGAREPRREIVMRDAAYLDVLLEHAKWFMACVENFTPPYGTLLS